MQNRSIMPARCAKWVQQYYVKVGNNRAKCVICDKELTMLLTFFITTNDFKEHIQQQHAGYLNSTITKQICWERRFYRREDTRLQCIICRRFYDITTYLNPRLKIHLQNEHQLYKNTKANRMQWLDAYFDRRQCKLCLNIYQRSPSVYYIKHLLKAHRVVLPFDNLEERLPKITIYKPHIYTPPRFIKWVRQYYVHITGKNHVKCAICDKKFTMLLTRYLRPTNSFKKHFQELHANYLYSALTKQICWERRFYKRDKKCTRLQCILCKRTYYIPAYVNPRLKIHLEKEHQIYKNTTNKRIQWLNKYFNGTQCKICEYSLQRSPSVYYIKHLLNAHQVIPFSEQTG